MDNADASLPGRIARTAQAALARIHFPRERLAWLRTPTAEAAALALLALVLHLAGNGQTSLWDRDEPRYAGCAREMRASGDYIHPTFNAEPRYHKPILTYWVMQFGVAVAGDNTFGNRLTSGIFGAGTVLLVWSLGRRLFGPNVGRLAALVMLSAPITVAESKLATTDATLFFFVTACYWAVWELTQRPSTRWAAIFWVAFSLAVLTKGPVAPVFLTTTAAISLLWKGPTLDVLRRLQWRWGFPLFLVLVAPWYIAIGLLSKGAFYDVAMGRHVIHRMTSPMETHGGFPGYYVAGSLIGFYPWSVLLPAALVAAWKRRAETPALGFLAGWVLGTLITLEIIRTKLIHYYLPAYAGAALIAAWFVVKVAASEQSLRRWPLGRLAVGLLLGIGMTLAVGLASAGFIAPGSLKAPCLVLAAVIAAGTLVSAEHLHRAATGRAAGLLAGTWILALLLLGVWVLPATEPYRLAPRVGKRLAEVCRLEGAAPLLSGFQPPAVVYHFGAPIPVRRDPEWLEQYVRSSGKVVVALQNHEVQALRQDPGDLAFEVREKVRGFNVERGRDESLRLVVLRPASSDELAARKQSLVK